MILKSIKVQYFSSNYEKHIRLPSHMTRINNHLIAADNLHTLHTARGREVARDDSLLPLLPSLTAHITLSQLIKIIETVY